MYRALSFSDLGNALGSVAVRIVFRMALFLVIVSVLCIKNITYVSPYSSNLGGIKQLLRL